MPLLPDDEQEISLTEARLLFIHRPTLRTLRSYIQAGYGKNGKGKPVFLDGAMMGRSYVTSREAIARFKKALKLRSQNGTV